MASKILDKLNKHDKKIKELESHIDNVASYIARFGNEQISISVLLDTIIEISKEQDKNFEETLKQKFDKNLKERIKALEEAKKSQTENAQKLS